MVVFDGKIRGNKNVLSERINMLKNVLNERINMYLSIYCNHLLFFSAKVHQMTPWSIINKVGNTNFDILNS